jgi:hypothetical protein
MVLRVSVLLASLSQTAIPLQKIVLRRSQLARKGHYKKQFTRFNALRRSKVLRWKGVEKIKRCFLVRYYLRFQEKVFILNQLHEDNTTIWDLDTDKIHLGLSRVKTHRD